MSTQTERIVRAICDRHGITADDIHKFSLAVASAIALPALEIRIALWRCPSDVLCTFTWSPPVGLIDDTDAVVQDFSSSVAQAKERCRNMHGSPLLSLDSLYTLGETSSSSASERSTDTTDGSGSVEERAARILLRLSKSEGFSFHGEDKQDELLTEDEQEAIIAFKALNVGEVRSQDEDRARLKGKGKIKTSSATKDTALEISGMTRPGEEENDGSTVIIKLTRIAGSSDMQVKPQVMKIPFSVRMRRERLQYAALAKGILEGQKVRSASLVVEINRCRHDSTCSFRWSPPVVVTLLVHRHPGRFLKLVIDDFNTVYKGSKLKCRCLSQKEKEKEEEQAAGVIRVAEEPMLEFPLNLSGRREMLLHVAFAAGIAIGQAWQKPKLISEIQRCPADIYFSKCKLTWNLSRSGPNIGWDFKEFLDKFEEINTRNYNFMFWKGERGGEDDKLENGTSSSSESESEGDAGGSNTSHTLEPRPVLETYQHRRDPGKGTSGKILLRLQLQLKGQFDV